MKIVNNASLILFSVLFFLLSSATAIGWEDWGIWSGNIYVWRPQEIPGYELMILIAGLLVGVWFIAWRIRKSVKKN